MELDRVLLIADGDNVTVGKPVIDGAKVLATAQKNGKGEKIIVFEDVPAEVCQQCGEVYFSPEVLEKMDAVTMGEEEPKATISVPIFSLAEAVTA